MITKEEVQHIAGLARIGLSEEEVEKYSHDISAVLDWMKELESLDVSNAEPASNITGMLVAPRQDREGDFGNKNGIKALFPEEKNGYDKVKSVL